MPFTLVLLGIALIAGSTYAVIQMMRLRAERARLNLEIADLKREVEEHRSREVEATKIRKWVKMSDGQGTPVRLEVEAPARAPDVRVLPPAPRELAQERITQGLHEFRSGRFLQAELAFLRAVPEAYGYIVLTCFVRGDVREAVLFLGRALASDPEWLRRVKPRDLFGAPEEYEKALRALEERVTQDPLDAEAKTLLAYFRLHEKGPEYAKALLVEAVNAAPGHAEAKRFLEALGP